MNGTSLRRAALSFALNLPDGLLRRIAGPVVTNDRGDILDLQTQALLTLSLKLKIPRLHTLPVEEARRQTVEDTALIGIEPPTMLAVHALTLPGSSVAMRHYDPGGLPPGAPLLLFGHGGGFVVGDLDSHDICCRLFARDARCHVLAVDYRCAPEHPFPAATDDMLAAWRWVSTHAEELGADPQRVVIGGDSAGGNLATVTCLRARDCGDPLPMGQLLIYPAVDMTHGMASHQRFAEGFFLDAEMIAFFMERYLGADNRTHPDASPWHVESVAGLPPTVVITAGFDPLRDEGEAWAERLREADVPVTARCEPNLVHGFMNMDGVAKEARAANARMVADLRALFGRPTS